MWLLRNKVLLFSIIFFITPILSMAEDPKKVEFTVSRHPLLSAPKNLQALFNQGTALLRRDDDGPGSGTENDVSFHVTFTLSTAVQSTFPDQSVSTFPANERYNYRLPKYNEIRNDLYALQLRQGTFADLKQIEFGRGFTGWANSNNRTIIFTQSIIGSTTVHEWGHLCGIPHRNSTTHNIMYPYKDENRKEINIDEKASMLNY